MLAGSHLGHLMIIEPGPIGINFVGFIDWFLVLESRVAVGVTSHPAGPIFSIALTHPGITPYFGLTISGNCADMDKL